MPTRFQESQKDEFNRFFEHAEVPDNAALRIEFETLLRFMGDLRGKRVLDLGCGVGRNGIQLAPHAGEVVGYDMSEVGIAKANQIAQEVGATNFRAELDDFSEVQENSFDVILCVNMLHHAASPGDVLRSVGKALRPGGSLIVMENNPLNPLFPLFFLMIGQLRAHLTRQYLMVNRFTLARMMEEAGLELAIVQRHGFLPTALYNHSLAFKSVNEALNQIPLLNELTAFYLMRAVKPVR